MNQQMLGHDIPILHTFDIQLFPRVAADAETELTRPQCGVLLQFAAQKNYSRTGNLGWVLLCFSYSRTKILPWYLFKEMLEHVQLTESCLVSTDSLCRNTTFTYNELREAATGRQRRGSSPDGASVMSRAHGRWFQMRCVI